MRLLKNIQLKSLREIHREKMRQLKVGRAELEAEFKKYNENAEIQKRELQQQIDELTEETENLTQQLKSLY